MANISAIKLHRCMGSVATPTLAGVRNLMVIIFILFYDRHLRFRFPPHYAFIILSISLKLIKPHINDILVTKYRFLGTRYSIMTSLNGFLLPSCL